MQLPETFLSGILRCLKGYTNPSLMRVRRFAVLFASDQEFKLLHTRRMVNWPEEVIRTVAEYYEEYGASNAMYSHRLV